MATTQLLQQAITKLQRLPADEQDAIAYRLLAEWEDEQAWSERFRATTDAQWDRLAAAVRQEIAAGDLCGYLPRPAWSYDDPPLF